MANREPGLKARFESLSQDASLELLLPRSSNFDVSGILRNGSLSLEDLSRASSRRNLFFDERAKLTLILRTTEDEEAVRSLLPNLEIVLAPHATDAVPQGSGNTASASGKHDLASITIPGTEFADIIPANGSTYAIWKPAIHLPRPRVRLQRPAIYFTAFIGLTAEALASSKQTERQYLKSFEPLPANVLEPLQFDPSLSSSKVYVSESRITKMAPIATMQDEVKPVRGATRRAFPVVPALFTRIRYSALPDAMVASLHIETSQVVTSAVTIKGVSLSVPNAHVENLCPKEWPAESFGGDEIVLLYKLKRKAETDASISNASVAIEASTALEQGSQVELDVRWQAQVDLSQTLAKPNYKWGRPLSGFHQSRPSLQADSSEANQKTAVGEGGVTFNFTAPPTTIVNNDLTLHVQCINRSGRPRRFALVDMPPKKAAAKTHKATKSEDADMIAAIFNAPLLEQQKPPDVLDLNPDVRVGPLPAGASFETDMRFRALATGVLDIGVVRIVDLDTRQTVDVRELPDVVGVEADDVK